MGALARLRGRDLQDHGTQRALRFREKNGKDREIPVRHDLEQWLLAYLAAAAIPASSDAPLFQSAITGRPRREDDRPLFRPAPRRLLDPQDAETKVGRGWPAGDAPSPLVQGARRDRPAPAERPARRCPVPRRTLESADNPALRPPAAARDTQHRRANLRLIALGPGYGIASGPRAWPGTAVNHFDIHSGSRPRATQPHSAGGAAAPFMPSPIFALAAGSEPERLSCRHTSRSRCRGFGWLRSSLRSACK